MVFSEFLLKIPYTIAWHTLKILKKTSGTVFYCKNYQDYVILKNLIKKFDNITIITEDTELNKQLKLEGYEVKSLPVFPDNVIMARHANHKFPCSAIKKIGLRHGVYHFKNFISPIKYNVFDLFLFTSESEVLEAKEIGITCGTYGGYPKIDDFNEDCSDLRNKFDDRPIILFSATYTKSQLSAIDRWYDKLDKLKDKYNILVTIHPFNDKKYSDKLKSIDGVTFLENENLIPYMKISDILISDTSSIIGEYVYQIKPIITFKIPLIKRLGTYVYKMLPEISYQIDEFEELESTIDKIISDGVDEVKLNKMEEFKSHILGDSENHTETAYSVINNFLNMEQETNINS